MKRKERKIVHNPETLTSKSIPINPIKQEDDEGIEMNTKEQQKGFFACYLLTSLCPRYKGHTYVGFTVNPRRRIRQHNGEIRCGAFRTKKRRPWEMVLCIYGFPTNVSALQFEWAWQHPSESRAVRQAAATFKSFSGVSNKIKLAYTMLNLPSWRSLNITVNYFSTKYSKHSANCPSLPEHVKVQVRSMDELPCYIEGDESSFGDEDGQGDEDCDEASENLGNLADTYKDATNNFSSDYTFSTDEASYEQGGQLKQYGNEQPRDSSCPEVDLQQPFGLIGLLDATSSSSVIPINLMEETDDMSWQQSDENQQPFPTQEQSTTAEVATKDQKIIRQSTVVQNVEVVDLLTPSPSCRIMSCGRKRKFSSVSPVIIDLT